MADHVWPELALSWRSALGTVAGFLGAALGTAGGVGGGGIFVPAVHIIIGFDTKSSTAISKCMIMGATITSIAYNLGLKHPIQRDLPVIDYDIAMVLQPMLLLGISIGVIFNSIFPTWILTLLLIAVMLGTGIRVFIKALGAWRKETEERKLQEERALLKVDLQSEESRGDYSPLRGGDEGGVDTVDESWLPKKLIKNIMWKNVGILFLIWTSFLILQILQSRAQTCSAQYWILNSLQIPVAVFGFLAAARKLYKKTHKKDAISVLSREESGSVPVGFRLLAISAAGSLVGGTIGGLLGLGGGFALGPLLLELGVHPQVFSATATFAMFFSSSMSVVEYYLLHRFPVPYALYLIAVSMLGGFAGQYVIQSLVRLLGRASIIVILLCVLTFFSATVLGGLGIQDAVVKLKAGEYMGFSSLC